jgi:Family of unknown function (DUF5906)
MRAPARLGEMNEEHHVVNLGGKTLVLSWDYEDEIYPGRPIATYRSPAEFCKFYDKWTHTYPSKNKKGDPVEAKAPFGTWWWENGGRRQYGGVVYAPNINDDVVGGKLNLWRGFSVAPAAGDCSLYFEHLRNNVCVDKDGQPHQESYDYLIGWMAYAAQHPERQGQVAWVMLGKKGIGKTVAGAEFGKLFEFHYVEIVNPDHMTGKFNQHLQSCSVLLADECFFAGDRKHEQILKTLITGDRIFVEPKGVNGFQVKNYLHIIMCTNSNWAVPASHDERRYFVLKVGEKHIQDIPYFKTMCDQMDNGGRAALLHMLLNLNLGEHTVGGKPFEVRRAPTTDALRGQQEQSRHGIDALVEDMLINGHVLFSHHNRPFLCITSGEENDKGFDHFIRKKASLDMQRLGPTRVKAVLKQEWDCKHFHGRIAGAGSGVVAGIEFPPLQEMRAAFEKRHGKILWPGPKGQQGRAAMTDSRSEACARCSMPEGKPSTHVVLRTCGLCSVFSLWPVQKVFRGNPEKAWAAWGNRVCSFQFFPSKREQRAQRAQGRWNGLQSSARFSSFRAHRAPRHGPLPPGTRPEREEPLHGSSVPCITRYFFASQKLYDDGSEKPSIVDAFPAVRAETFSR